MIVTSREVTIERLSRTRPLLRVAQNATPNCVVSETTQFREPRGPLVGPRGSPSTSASNLYADIDECDATLSSPCHAEATCSNTDGNFTCTCNPGYEGDGITCDGKYNPHMLDSNSNVTHPDIDECTDDADNCDAYATCTNTVGNFTCTCNPGYEGDGITCDGKYNPHMLDSNSNVTHPDIDECTDDADNCDAYATCTNTVGNFTCACNSGFTGNGTTCTGKHCSHTLDSKVQT